MEHFKASEPLGEGVPATWCQKIKLRVTAHTEDVITMAEGEKYNGYCGAGCGALGEPPEYRGSSGYDVPTDR